MKISGVVDATRGRYGELQKPAIQAVDQMLRTAQDKMLVQVRPVIQGLKESARSKDSAAFHQQVAGLRGAVRDALSTMSDKVTAASVAGQQYGRRAGTQYGIAALQIGLVTGIARATVQALDEATNYVNSVAFTHVSAQFAMYHANKVADMASGMVATDEPWTKIAQVVANYMAVAPLADATRLARTATIYAMRGAAQATFQANSDVVSGWMWSASLDSKCCMSCVAMNGTVHGLDETLNDHDQGRCAPVPITRSWADMGYSATETTVATQSGSDWFEAQPVATQKQMMGAAAWQAWQAGQFALSDYPTTYTNSIFGTMVREKSLKELLNG